MAKTFSNTPGWKAKGLTRRVQSSSAQKLANMGVDLVQADLDQPSTLIDAFRDADAIFANTDFFALTKHPDLAELLNSTYVGKPLNQACMEHELQQGKNIIDAAAQVLAEGCRLQHFIQSTLSYASKRSNGAVQQLLHFDSKGMIEEYLRAQPALAATARYLQVGYYMSNALSPMLQPRQASDGVFEFFWPNISPETVLTAVSSEDDTGVFVRALIEADPGTILLGEGDPMTVEEFLHVWSSVTGQRSRLRHIDSDMFVAMVDAKMPTFGVEFADNFRYYRDFTYTGRDSRVKRPAELGISKVDLTTYHQYLSGLEGTALGLPSER